MIYCLNCGARNEMQSAKCQKCGMTLKTGLVTKGKVRSEPRVSEIDIYEPEVNNPIKTFSQDLMPEPLSEEELNSFKVAGANETFNLKDIMSKNASKKKSKPRKRKKD